MEKTKINITDESHLDHGVNDRTLDWLRTLEVPVGEVSVQTLRLPDSCADLMSALRGPLAGDPPVPERYVSYVRRGARNGLTRVLLGKRPRPTRFITVVTGPHNGAEGVLYTCYGGKEMPQEPWEFSGDDIDPEKYSKSIELWSTHALAHEGGE